MSLAINSPSVRNLKSLKLPFMMVFGAVFSLGAAIGLQAIQSDVPAAATISSTELSSSRTAPLPHSVFYLVDSSEQAAQIDGVEGAESRLRYEIGGAPDPTYLVFVIDSPEAEAAAIEIIAAAGAESAASGLFTTTVIDARGHEKRQVAQPRFQI